MKPTRVVCIQREACLRVECLLIEFYILGFRFHRMFSLFLARYVPYAPFTKWSFHVRLGVRIVVSKRIATGSVYICIKTPFLTW